MTMDEKYQKYFRDASRESHENIQKRMKIMKEQRKESLEINDKHNNCQPVLTNQAAGNADRYPSHFNRHTADQSKVSTDFPRYDQRKPVENSRNITVMGML